MLDESLPFELATGLYALGDYRFFSFLVTGATHALIEMGISATAPLVADQLKELGVDPGEVAYLVVLHAHFDHLGGLPYYRALFPQAQIVCSSGARETMSNPRLMEHFFREDAVTSARLAGEGNCGRTFSWLPGSILEADMVVGDGDSLVLGTNSTLQFIAAPGHSPCSLAAYLPERKTMLVSDSIGFFPEPGDNLPLFFYDYAAYLETISRLQWFSPAIVAGAHKFIFRGNEAAGCFTVAEESARDFRWFVRTFQGEREELVTAIFNRFYQGCLQVFTPQNIRACAELLIRRA